ncbi:MAG: hypothetical protein ABIH79_02010 [archaeon]
MILEEITLGKDVDSKRKVIQDNRGKQVIINDLHENWAHGVISWSGFDNEVYQMYIADGRGERQLHYHDLNQLLVLPVHPKYELPRIK